MSYSIEFIAPNVASARHHISEDPYVPSAIKGMLIACLDGIHPDASHDPVRVKASGHVTAGNFQYDAASWGEFNISSIRMVDHAPDADHPTPTTE